MALVDATVLYSRYVAIFCAENNQNEFVSEPVCGGGRLFPADAVLRLRAGAGQEEREVRGGLPPREGRRHREAQVLRRRHRRQAERQPRQPAAGQVPDQRQEERVPGLQVKGVNQISQNAIFREGPF